MTAPNLIRRLDQLRRRSILLSRNLIRHRIDPQTATAGGATQALTEARLYWVDHAGHCISWDAPDEALRLIWQGITPTVSTTSA